MNGAQIASGSSPPGARAAGWAASGARGAGGSPLRTKADIEARTSARIIHLPP